MTELEKDIDESMLKPAEELAEKVRELEVDNDALGIEVEELEECLAAGKRDYAALLKRNVRLSRARQEMKSQAYYMANTLNAVACAAGALGNLDAGQRAAAVPKCLEAAGVLARECAYAQIGYTQNGDAPEELAERVAQAAKRFLVQTGEILAAIEDGED
jgi:hypothetical protein